MLEPTMRADGTARTAIACSFFRSFRLLAAACVAVAMAACESGSGDGTALASREMGRPEAGTAAADGSEHALDADAGLARQLARGEILSFACRPCHGLAPGDESPVGPHLYGMFGRSAGSLEGFEYSAALRESGIVWTAETLDAWLTRPDELVPGNDMEFAGFRSADDRRALIAYLRQQTERAGESAPSSPDSRETSD